MDPSPSRRAMLFGEISSDHRPSPPRRQPSLLPAFEPISSSPLPAQNLKRKHVDDTVQSRLFYPTPVPTSSTVIPTSPTNNHPSLQRMASYCSERAPLQDVQTVNIPLSGDVVRLGRSSNSCDFQLPYNRLISRVHVAIRFEYSESDASGSIVIKCLGWNGCKVHCGGRVHDLAKDEEYSATRPTADIILDVHDARVAVAWPDVEDQSSLSDGRWKGDSSPESPLPRRNLVDPRSSPPPLHPQSPISPSPARRHPLNRLAQSPFPPFAPLPAQRANVAIYEDPESGRESKSPTRDRTAFQSFETVKDNSPTLWRKPQDSLRRSAVHSVSDQENEEEDNEENEENDPIVHSFGPFGSNILSRLGSFNTSDSPEAPAPASKRQRPLFEFVESEPQQDVPSPLKPSLPVSPQKPARVISSSPIKNHVINQLAFSLVHAVPLSAILGKLPVEMKAIKDHGEPLTKAELKAIIDNTPCVGEIHRSGKDAAGHALENEFYYLPDNDDNMMRRNAVRDSRGGTGLRAVRKTHKQYYWKKPRA